MALATVSDTPPTADDPGLTARLSSLCDGLSSLVSDLRPECIAGSDAALLYGSFARLGRLVDAGKTVLAPRIADSKHWEEVGHTSAESLLSTLDGGLVTDAKRTLATGRRLEDLPATEEAVRAGTLSGLKAAAITEAATLDPSCEQTLLEGSESDSASIVQDRCRRVRATSRRHDPLSTMKRIYASRSFNSWMDEEGAFCFRGRDTAERGAKMLAALGPLADRLREDRRAARMGADANPAPGSPAPERASEAALRADALYLALTGRHTAHPGPASPDAPVTSGPPPATPGSPSATTASGPGSSESPGPMPTTTVAATGPGGVVATEPSTMVMVRVDLAALRRGRVLPGETCELDGSGPLPVPVVRNLLDDAFIAYVFTEAGDIRAISHHGRTINRRLRTALSFRDRCCVVPNCGITYGLEIDHVIPLEHGGLTELDNLALLCHQHHRLKTYDGWTLARTGATDKDPGWTFTPLPPFGQEPDLGLDRPPEPVPRV